MKVLPKSVKRIAVLDRTKEIGANGEPLFLDVKECSTIKKNVRNFWWQIRSFFKGQLPCNDDGML
jgi:pyruvate/2-oxoacid:ferredoxin oxidoreductase alpha subunit